MARGNRKRSKDRARRDPVPGVGATTAATPERRTLGTAPDRRSTPGRDGRGLARDDGGLARDDGGLASGAGDHDGRERACQASAADQQPSVGDGRRPEPVEGVPGAYDEDAAEAYDQDDAGAYDEDDVGAYDQDDVGAYDQDDAEAYDEDETEGAPEMAAAQQSRPRAAAVRARGGRSEAPEARPAPREPDGENLATRTARFLQGSWRELQRVQWPDRRQVMQATGVVIGFVIVAGVILGVSDLISEKIVNFIINH